MRRTWPVILVAVTAGLSALGTGCGGDEDPITPISSSTTEAATPGVTSDEDFVSSGDAICAETNAAIANLTSGTELSSATAAQQLEITEGQLESLQALGDPDDPSGALDDYYAALADQVAILADQGEALAAGDAATASALAADLDAAESAALTAASDFGFDECGQEGTALPSTGTSTSDSGVPAPGTAPVTPTPPVEPAPVPVDPAPAPVEPAAPPAGGAGTEAPPPAPAPSGGSSGGGIAP